MDGNHTTLDRQIIADDILDAIRAALVNEQADAWRPVYVALAEYADHRALAGLAVATGHALIDCEPCRARGVVHAMAEALPHPMRPTRWPDKRESESPASFLRSETIEDVSNWADLASEFELMATAAAAVQRMTKGARQRFLRAAQSHE